MSLQKRGNNHTNDHNKDHNNNGNNNKSNSIKNTNSTVQKIFRISAVNVTKSAEAATLVTFTEKILNGKFLCSSNNNSTG